MIKAAKLWLHHIIHALPLSSLSTLPLFQASFHLCAAFKACQLTFQRAGWTSRCLCGGLPLGLCVALSVDRHMGSCLCLPGHFCHFHSSHCLYMFNVYAFHFSFFSFFKAWTDRLRCLLGILQTQKFYKLAKSESVTLLFVLDSVLAFS